MRRLAEGRDEGDSNVSALTRRRTAPTLLCPRVLADGVKTPWAIPESDTDFEYRLLTWYFVTKSARMRALAYMDVGGRAMQEQLPNLVNIATWISTGVLMSL